MAHDMTADLGMALDPLLLAEATGIQPDPWQGTVLRSTSRRLLLNCCRQSGKSTTVATLVCHTALYDPGSLTLILSPGERQSKETFRKMMDVYDALDHPLPPDSETKLELELANGSRIIALPGANDATIRGYSGVRLLVIDEASRVADSLYNSVRPMLAVSGGRLVVMSTPWGKRGFFWEAWEQGQGWEKIEITALDCPRISAEFLAEEKENLPDLFFKSEYLCQFTDAIDSVFSMDLIQAAVQSTLPPLVDDVLPLGVW